MNSKAKSTIEKRLKVITKTVKVNKEAWDRAEKIRRKAMKKNPSYTDEWDSWKHPYERDDEYKRAISCIDSSVKRYIALKDERKYLKGLVEGDMVNFDTTHWEYDGVDVDLLSMEISPPRILEND